ncbi:DnaD domain protein [Macrococcus psychrotolerans]|uniref:DnaD domain protein n=1 Tax=Macrococcus psychrotolerans TaxID=3039389 RepID=A0AAT9P2Y9_9STAP|nr:MULTISPECIES: DnaD domain protein [Macrococcus]QYA32019.1 DnaD domain protein [Macrococcus sp. 19Msa1099]QYA36825.1 DnaD domain protein [Macrococcus caseolyticus]QYA75533.1 DnaD domain protein [Macrococcus caseolyticus]
MSTHRYLNVSFWQDAFVLDLTPEEKYFYIYLMTNSKTSQIGIYELPSRVIELETGYNRETVEKLLTRFIEYGKIEYNQPTKEIYIRNWAKFNWNNSEKVITRVKADLENVKHQPFAIKYVDYVNSLEKNNKVIQYPYSIDSLWKKEKEKKEKEKEIKEKENERETTRPSSFDIFEQGGYGYLDPITMQKLFAWIDDFGDEGDSIVSKALDVGIEAGIKNYKYVNGILRNWHNKGFKTTAEIDANEIARQTKDNNQVKPNVQTTKRSPEEIARLKERNERNMRQMLGGEDVEIITE